MQTADMTNAVEARQSVKNGATVGYEAELWRMADALRGSTDAAEYKHIALGLIFLKYVFDASKDDGEPFEDKMARLSARWRERQAEARRLDDAIRENLTALGFSVE